MKNCSKCSKWANEGGCHCSDTRQKEETNNKNKYCGNQLEEGAIKICNKEDCNCSGCRNCAKE